MHERFSFRQRVDIKIPSRRFIAVSLLIASNLSWFLVVNSFFQTILVNYLAVQEAWASLNIILFYGSGAFFALIGSTFSARINRRILLSTSITLGVLASAFMPFFQGTLFALLLSILFGFSIGFGFPSALAFLSDSTEPEERGRVSGLVILLTFVLAFIGIASIFFLEHSLWAIILFLVFSRALGLVPLLLDSCKRAPKKETSWKNVLHHKNFGLYLLPWVLFCLAVGFWDWSASTLSQQLESARAIGISVSLVFMALSGVVAGTLADRWGRKQPIIIALVLIGLSLALVSLIQIPETIIVYYSVYGIAWGFLFTLYITIQGDFAPLHVKEKFYALGTALPLVIFMGSTSTLTFVLGDSGVPINLLSPFLSAIIFLSVIPIWRASETLSTSKINERKIKEHLKEIEKIIKESKE